MITTPAIVFMNKKGMSNNALNLERSVHGMEIWSEKVVENGC